MPSERRQPWHINVHAKAKYFDFKFEATNNLTISKLSPFPFKLKVNLELCPSMLQANKSKPQLPIPREGKSKKPKFLRILGKFRPRASKNKSTSAKQTPNLEHPDVHFAVNQPRHFAYEEPVCISSIVIGFLVLLFQSLSQKDRKGIILYSLIILLYLALIFKNHITRRTRNILVILIVSAAIWVSILNISEASVSDWVWKALNSAPLSNILKISEGYVSDWLNNAWIYAPFSPGNPTQAFSSM